MENLEFKELFFLENLFLSKFMYVNINKFFFEFLFEFYIEYIGELFCEKCCVFYNRYIKFNDV